MANAAASELKRGLSGLLAQPISQRAQVDRDGAVIVALAGSPELRLLHLRTRGLGTEGYVIRSATLNGHTATVIAANSERGAALRRVRAAPRGSRRGSRSAVSTSARRARMSRCACSTIGTISIGSSCAAMRACRCGTGRRCRACRPALHRLCPRQCLDRHQRRGPQQRQLQRRHHDARLSRAGQGARRHVPALRHPRLSLRPVQRADGDGRPAHGRSARSRACAHGGGPRPTRSIA